MSEHGAALQTYNQEGYIAKIKAITNVTISYCQHFLFLWKIGLEDLKFKRNEIIDIIYKQEAEKVILEKKLEALQNRLTLLNKNLEYHKNVYESYDKTITETENGFKKILESSQALLHLAQHEANKLECNNNSKKDVFMHCKNINDY